MAGAEDLLGAEFEELDDPDDEPLEDPLEEVDVPDEELDELDEPESPDLEVEVLVSLAAVLPASAVPDEDSDFSPLLTALTAPERESVR